MKKILFLLIISATVFSCRVTFAPAKDASMIVNVMDIQDKTNTLYDGIIASTDKSFDTYANEYTSLDRKIDSVVAMNKDRKNAGNIHKQASLLQTHFKRYAADHKNKGTLRDSEARVYRDYLQSFIKPILVSEFSLK